MNFQLLATRRVNFNRIVAAGIHISAPLLREIAKRTPKRGEKWRKTRFCAYVEMPRTRRATYDFYCADRKVRRFNEKINKNKISTSRARSKGVTPIGCVKVDNNCVFL